MLNSDSDQVSQNITHSSVFSSRSRINQQSFSINSNALSINTRNFFQNHQEEYKENCDKSTFYWLPLTQMDIQFLKTAENSLKSNDPKKIKSYCTFLQTIVFNDFPAEIFLQRSTILKILIDLNVKFTNNQESDEEISLLKCLITCFSYYLSKLIKRIRYVKDPATFCFKDFYSNGYDYFSKSIILNYGKKQDTSRSINCNTSLYSVESDTTSTISSIKSSARSSAQSTATIKSKNNSKFKSSISQPSLKKNQSVKSSKNDATRYSLDESKTPQFEEEFQDIQQSIESFLAETNNENYETDINNMSTIRREQEWPVYSFCFRLIDTLLDNLNLIMVKNNKNQKLDTCLLPLICETLNGSIEILNETKLEWTGLNINETLVNLFGKINFNIRFLINKNESVSSEAYLNIKNRLLYVFLVHCLAKIINLIYSSEETSILIPGELAETIFIILNDICLLDSFKSLSHVFPTLLINLDKNLYDIYILSNEICDSMKCACEFLQNFSQHSKQDLVQLAKKSLNFMDYHVCVELSAKIVEFASATMSLDKEAEAFKADIEYLVTGCMMSKNDLIRIETYSAIYRIINDSINVQVATEINSKRYKNINFLLLNKVFYHYITFGLFDKSIQVKKSCEKILLHLLQCELLVPESFRLKLTQLIVIYMPYIQCFASQIETLGQCILKMSDDLLTPTINSSQSKQTEESLKLFLSPAIERLRCSMRYLFSK
ncbi:rotatin, partial [Brachionus plicatilis]